ncbi:MAG: preprotein translocase subunit SecE [Sarcina sp.]
MTAKQNVKESKKRFSLTKFFREVKAEVKRITWPSKEDTKKAVLAVFVFAIAFIVLVGGMDFIFKNLFDLVFGLK